MPLEAKVAIVEDDQRMIDDLNRNLERGRHSVVYVARKVDQGFELLRRISEEGFVVDVLTLDNDLGLWGGGTTASILEEMRRLGINIPTVGLSGRAMRGVTIDLGKANMFRIAAVIDEL
jgi:ActR/RegA family two-component response regulator